MLTLNDGRNELWQWDTGRKLTVDADCSQVHFSNKVFGRSIDVDVVDGIAIIPDILLQTDKELTAWAFVGTAENGYTKISKTFKVNKRNKPADYVFTPAEQTTLDEIMERLDSLEATQDPDAIKNAVEDYLEQNPVEAPVESVNGKTGEVKLTAEDVGAISRDDLQEATNEALAQAKASGAFDGKDGKDGEPGKDGYTPVKGVDYFDGADGKDYILTEADKQEIAEQAAELVDVPESDLSGLVKSVNGIAPDENGNVEVSGGVHVTGATVGQTVKISAVDDSGIPTAWEAVDFPSGGGGEEWELMATVDMVQDAKYAQVDLPYPVKKLFVVCNGSDTAAATKNGTFCIASGKYGYNNQKMAVSSATQDMSLTYRIITIDIDLTRHKPLSEFQVGDARNRAYFIGYKESMTPSRIFITSHDATMTFNAKTWYVYGVRA